MSTSPLAGEILAALKNLRDGDCWRRLFADVVCFVTYEKFLQACFVAAFNSRPVKQYVSSAEFEKVDFAFINLRDKNEWWQTQRPDSELTQERLVVGLMELKICYPAPWYQYGPIAKADAVAGDIKKLRQKASEAEVRKELFVLLAIGQFFPRDLPNEIEKKDSSLYEDEQYELNRIEKCEREFWNRLESKTGLTTESQIGDVWLLKHEPVPSEPKRRAHVKAILIEVPEDNGSEQS